MQKKNYTLLKGTHILNYLFICNKKYILILPNLYTRLDLEKSQSGQYSKFLSHLSRCNPNSVLLLEPGHPRNNANNNINGNAQMELARVATKPKTRVDIEAGNDYATQIELPKCVKFFAFVLLFGIVITLLVLMILNSKGYWNTRGLGSPFKTFR